MNQTGIKLDRIETAPQTLRDIVQTKMRDAIMSGHFAPGERLVERPLCEQLGVSRTVVRETIRYLEAEGLVETIAHKGPIVATLNWSQAKQIYDIRRQLESAAAEAAAKASTPAFELALRAALTKLDDAMSAQDWSVIFAATTAFYELIFKQADHNIAWEIVQRLNGRISRLRALTLSAKDRTTSGLAHMSAISDAIIRSDARGAREAVKAHIKDAAKIAQAVLAQETHND
ncbi:GntR family transcriptional regulator [Lentibacter sp.]|jgi:DNA-binding GntR family transcriptional regulator|uniref:GntR family transcriptional regulator n=1 Tax=Lentibacter sp. TaxID=2024994 RepID=UPI003F69DC20